MAISVQWFDPEQTIVYQHLTPGITYTDMFVNTTCLYDMVQSKPHTVNVITELDCTIAELLSVGVFQFLQQANPLVAPNTGRIMVVGETFAGQTLMPVARLLAPHITRRVCFHDSVVDAVYALELMRVQPVVLSAV